MRVFIKENFNSLLAVAVLIVCVMMLMGTNEILAKIMPNISEVSLVSYEVEKFSCAYTGKEVKPAITKLVITDENNQLVTIKKDDIHEMEYFNNVKCGTAGVEVCVDGYRGTLKLNNAFRIRPDQVSGVKVIQENRESIMIQWEKVYGAEGYCIYKSLDSGATYTLLADIPSSDVFVYEDKEVALNASYTYYVTAYVKGTKELMEGKASENAIQYTPLETVVLTGVKNTAYNTNQVLWNPVPGAAGYLVYRNTTQTGEYTCIAELTDGTLSSYMDTTCDCGIDYFYYVKATQLVNAETIYGDASAVLSVKTAPNRVGLNGSGNETQVNLSWKQSTGAQGYEIYRSINSTSNFQLMTKLDKSILNWSESGLDKHTSYYYRIRPYCVVNGTTVYGSYSGIYEKEAVIVYDYAGGTGADVLRQYVGRPYVFGGTSPTRGWDCSYFVKWTYATHFGIELPRTTGEQVGCGTAVSLNNRATWQPGDLIFYKEKGVVSHVAVYLGNGQMIHALSSKWDTLIQDVDYYETWDRKTSIYCVRRVLN